MDSSLKSSSKKYVIFSYHKNHQDLVLKIYNYLKNENLPVWINIEDGINNNIYQNADNIVENVSIIVCFMTPVYQASKCYQQEIEFAKNHGITIIGCYLLPNWKPSGWLSKITSDLLTVDLRGINQRNFQDQAKKLLEKITWMLSNSKNSQIINSSIEQFPLTIDEMITDQSIIIDDSKVFSLIEKDNLNCIKKKPIKYKYLPKLCRLHLSNIMICNNEYILINANNHLHLFDKNLKFIRSNNDIKINENDLKDLSWCSSTNNFIILTKKQIYTMNPLTSKLSIIENIKLNNRRTEYLTCSSSEEKFFLITCQYNSYSPYLEEYNLPTFRFIRKFKIIDFIGNFLFIENNENNHFTTCNINQILSIRYNQDKISIIMEISFNWFVYIFNYYDQPIFLTKIPLEEKSRMTIVNPINQWIIYKDFLSDTFIQISIHFQNKYDQQTSLLQFTKGFIDFNGKLRSVALFGISHIVFLIDNALVLYEI